MMHNSAFSQQPQAQGGQPLHPMNVKYVQGVGPGYWPTAGSNLTLNLAPGTAVCSNIVEPYGGGTLTLAPSATNYVYLNPTNSCAPASNTTGFTTGAIPIATVVTSSTSISSITDVRTMFVSNGVATSGGVTSVGMTGDGIIFSPTISGSPVTSSGTLAPQLATQAANTVLAGPLSGPAVTPTFRGLSATDLPATISSNTTGNATTATALASSPTQCTSNKWATGISTSGNANCSQPAFTNVSGTATITQGGTGQTTASAAFNALSPLTTEGDLHYYHSGTNARLGIGNNSQCLTSNGTDPVWGSCSTGTGTVTSVGLSMPSMFSVSGSPVTGSGTLTAALANQNAHLVLVGPSSGNAAPTFRALAGADLPAPTASTLGGIESLTCTNGQFLNQISTSGAPICGTPSGGSGSSTGLGNGTTVLDASLEAGSSFAAKTNAAYGALPSYGGGVDARGLGGSQSMPTIITVPNLTDLKLPIGTISSSSGSQLQLGNWSSVRGPGSAQATELVGAGTAPLFLLNGIGGTDLSNLWWHGPGTASLASLAGSSVNNWSGLYCDQDCYINWNNGYYNVIRDSILLGSNQNQDIFYGYNAFNSNNLSNLAIWGNGTAIHLDNSSVANKFDHIDVESSGLPFQVQSSNNTITGSYFEANGNCPSWSATTSYSVGACIIDSNNNMEVAVIPGTSGSSGPSWPSALQNFDPRLVPTKTADGTVVWKSAMRVTGIMLSGPNAVLNNVIGGYGSAGGNPVAVQDDSWGFNNALGAASSACFNVYNCLDGLQSHGFLTGDAAAAFLGGIWSVAVPLPAPTVTVPYSGGSTTVTYALNATLGDMTRGAYSQTGLSSFASVTNSVPRSQLGQVYAANVSHGQGTNYTLTPQCGSGYATGNTLTTTPSTGSLETGTGVVLTVTSVSSGGCVTGLSVTTVGSGYQPQFGVGTSAITGSGSGLLVDIYSYANKINFPWYVNITSLGSTWPVRTNSWLWDVAVNSSSQSLVSRFSGAVTTGGDIAGDNAGYVWDYGQTLSGYAAPSRNSTGDGYVAGKLTTTHNTLDDGNGNATLSGNATFGGTVATSHNTLEDGSGNMNAAGKMTAQQFCVGTNCVSSLWSNPMTMLGDLLFGSTSGAAARLGGNTTTTPMYLKSVGSCGSAAAPTLAQIQFADIAGTLAINAGGTGQTTASAAFNALSPLTTEGDLHYYHSSSNARLPVGSNGQCLISNGTDPAYGPCLVPSGSPSQYQTAVFSSPTAHAGVGPGSAGQILTSAGASANPVYSDFPNIVMPIQAATCSAGTGAPKWSYPSSGGATAACRIGSNVNMGILQFAQSNSAQFQLDIPGDWDSSSAVYAKIYLTQGSNTTSGQTIVMQIATACSSTTDDPPFTTAQSFSTATTTGTANTPFVETLSGLSMTNCVPGGNVNVKISRSSSDTATTPPGIVWASFTFQRLLAAGAD